MATTATPWSGEQAHKLYLQSGQFTSTVKDSEDVSSHAPLGAIGICWDGTDTPWASSYYDKLYLQSGQFESVIKTSQDISSIDNDPLGISADDNNTPWIGHQARKLYLTSGQFTSTLKDSEYIGAIENSPRDISYDGIDTPWVGLSGDKLYLQSEQFTSTIKDSEYIGSIETLPTGISWDGTNTPWAGAAANKLYLQSGQFTSTLITSEDVSGIDNVVVGISTDDYHSRITHPDRSITSNLAISDQVEYSMDYAPSGDTFVSGHAYDKLWLLSGQFTTAVKDSEDVSSINLEVTGLSWNDTDTLWSGAFGAIDKLYLQSGRFTSTIKDSENVTSIDTYVQDVSSDKSDAPWIGLTDSKLYLQSGQFTSTLKTSQSVNSIDTAPTGISWDGSNTPWIGVQNFKLYLQSGRFTSTVKDSEYVPGKIPQGISYDGTNTPWTDNSNDSLFLTSGQFTSTIKISLYIGAALDSFPTGTCFSDYDLRISNQLNQSLGHTLNLVQTLDVLADYGRNISSTMNLSHAVKPGQTHFESVSSEINLVTVMSQVKEATASSTMNLAQQIIKFHVLDDFIPVETVINFSQQAEWEVGNYQHIVQNLGLVQQVDWQGPHYFYINTYLTLLNQEVNAYHGCPWLPVEFEDALNLVSVINRTQDLDANNVIALAHEMYRSQTPESTLNLSQVVEAGKFKSIAPSELDLNQTVNLTGLFQRILEHTNIVGHSLTYYVDSLCGDKEYIPLIGETTISDAPTPPSIDKPIVQHDSTTTRFKLVYPGLATPTDEVELRAPELDNIDRLAFSRISRETRGGKLTVFADPNWPQVQTVIVTFIGLLKAEVNSLLDFLIAHVGEEIGMQDWEGREWIGIITTPNESAVQDGKQRWTVTFEFEGVLVDGYTPSDQLELVDTLDLKVDYTRGLTHDLGLIHSATFLLV